MSELRRHRLGALGCCVLYFIAIGFTLPWQQFSNGAENLVISTALEIRRGDSGWLVPTLQGEPRTAKPPLATWVTARAITDATLRELNSTNPATRDAAFRSLARQVRWPAVLCACLLLLGVFELGVVLVDSHFGLLSLICCATSLILLRFCRYATTDIALATWVTWSLVFLCLAVVRGKWWAGCIGAGVTLGLAMMSKGPVCLTQSVVPVVAWALLVREKNRPVGSSPARMLPLLTGTLVFLLVGFSWYGLVFLNDRGVLTRWWSEMTRIGATDRPATPMYVYLGFLGWMLPWTPVAIVGAIVAIRDRHRVALLALMATVLPIVILCFFRDRADRYLLPMAPAASLLAAIGLTTLLKSDVRRAVVWTVFPVTMVAQAIGMHFYCRTKSGRSDLKSLADAIVAKCPDAVVFKWDSTDKRPPPDLVVYLNRVIRNSADVNALAGMGKPTVVVWRTSGVGGMNPVPDWTPIAEALRDEKDVWRAAVRQP